MCTNGSNISINKQNYSIIITKRIDHWCSVGTGKSQPEGPPFQWETRPAEFPTGTVDPRVGISRFHCTPMIDSISHISNKE